MMLADCDRVRGRSDAAEQRAGFLAGERDDRFDLGILREAFGPRQIERAARFIESVITLPATAQPSGPPVRVPQEERRGVNPRSVADSGADPEPPEHGTRE